MGARRRNPPVGLAPFGVLCQWDRKASKFQPASSCGDTANFVIKQSEHDVQVFVCRAHLTPACWVDVGRALNVKRIN